MRFNFTLLALVFLSTTSVIQNDIHIITLNVNTANINNNNVTTECFFTPTQEVDIEDYNTMVNIDDIVLWKGISTDNPAVDWVEISSINYEGGERVFERNVLRDKPTSPGVVTGTVTQGRKGKFSKYKVTFRVTHNNQRSGNYHIDPKITIRE